MLRARSRARFLFASLFPALLVWIILPYDNPLKLFIRWQTHNLSYYAKLAVSRRPYSHHGNFPLNIDDIGFIIKTGYSTQDRLQARLETLDRSRNENNVVIVGDYSTSKGEEIRAGGKRWKVYNVLEPLLEEFGESAELDRSRLGEYRKLQAGVKKGDSDLPNNVNGWDLDILKHVPGFEAGYSLMPGKKWYIMSDDDTYLIPSSLLSILEKLDSHHAHYIGNAIGDFKARFAHGGSGIIFSQAALSKMTRTENLLKNTRIASLKAEFGDKVIAQMAMQAGIYLNEDFGIHFNGEPPSKTKVRADRFCVELVGFHKMSADEYGATDKVLLDTSEPVIWADVFQLFGARRLRREMDRGRAARRDGWDYVGALDEHTQTPHVIDEEGCSSLCSHKSSCLAWTWTSLGECHISPWITIGENAKGDVSGINIQSALDLLKHCRG